MKWEKMVSSLLIIVLTVMAPMVSYTKSSAQEVQQVETEFSAQDVSNLEAYVSVEDGHFYLDENAAQADGVNPNLITQQKAVFQRFNTLADQGKIIILNDLSIQSKNGETVAENFNEASEGQKNGECEVCHHGINDSAKYYWWGAQSYYCDCEARKAREEFRRGVATGTTAILLGGLGAIAYAAYCGALSNSFLNSNHGNGVIFNWYWTMCYNVDPQ